MVAEVSRLRGERWSAWFSEKDQQWLLKYRVRIGKWSMHRVPRELQEPVSVDRYCRIYTKTKRKMPSVASAVSADSISEQMTLRQLGEMWTAGKLASQFPRYIKAKKSADDDEARLRLYAYGHIGDVPIRDFAPPRGLELAERVMAALPPPTEFSQASARHVAQSLHRVLGLAVYPLRILPVHPLPRGFLPAVSNDKAKTYVYPDEDLQLMRCKDVPLVERLFYGLLAREGPRVSEVVGVQLYEFDLDHGWGHLDETKNGKPKDWPLLPGTVTALKRYRDRFMPSKRPHAHVFALPDGALLDRYTLAEKLRGYLKGAGVLRPQLFLRNEQRLALRAHDLRASFVTVALANGKTESWVADRTGHLSSQMINRYKRWARGHHEQNLGDWVPLCDAIPELAERPEATGEEATRNGHEHVAAGASNGATKPEQSDRPGCA